MTNTDNPEISEFFDQNRFFKDRMISPSKTAYIKMYKDRKPVFDARLSLGNIGIVWQGDIDLAIEEDTSVLQKLASTFNKNVYVLSEAEAMRFTDFNNEDSLRRVAKEVFQP